MSFLVEVVGGIATGKSSLLHLARRRPTEFLTDVIIFEEPILTWTKVGQNNSSLLEKFYEESSSATATVLQVEILTSFLKREAEVAKSLKGRGIVLTERSLSSAIYFIDALHRTGVLDLEAFQVLTSLIKTLVPTVPQPDLRIYLTTNTDTALDRIKKRGRPGEEKITAEYLGVLDECTEGWILCQDTPVRVIDATASKDEVFINLVEVVNEAYSKHCHA